MNGITWQRQEDWGIVAKGDLIRVTKGDVALEGRAYGSQERGEMRMELSLFEPRLDWLETTGFVLHIPIDGGTK